MGKRKRKRSAHTLTLRPLELLRALRKPRAPSTVALKDKRKYSRKLKHKNDYRKENG